MNDIVNDKKGHNIVNNIMNDIVNDKKGPNIVNDKIVALLILVFRDVGLTTMSW